MLKYVALEIAAEQPMPLKSVTVAASLSVKPTVGVEDVPGDVVFTLRLVNTGTVLSTATVMLGPASMVCAEATENGTASIAKIAMLTQQTQNLPMFTALMDFHSPFINSFGTRKSYLNGQEHGAKLIYKIMFLLDYLAKRRCRERFADVNSAKDSNNLTNYG